MYTSEENSRTELLIGADGIRRLAESAVAVFGLGGVGSHCTEALARAGVGHLILTDCDRVSLSNINRQSIALHSTVGRYKTAVMKEKILDISPDIKVDTYELFVLPDNIEETFKEKPDYIVDAVDTVAAKLAIACYARREGIPMISCMGTGNRLNPGLFEIADIYSTSGCPLCRVMRRELRARGFSRLKVLYSKEKPVKSCAEDSEGRRITGSISFVPPAAGFLIAGEVIRCIAGVENNKR